MRGLITGLFPIRTDADSLTIPYGLRSHHLQPPPSVSEPPTECRKHDPDARLPLLRFRVLQLRRHRVQLAHQQPPLGRGSGPRAQIPRGRGRLPLRTVVCRRSFCSGCHFLNGALKLLLLCLPALLSPPLQVTNDGEKKRAHTAHRAVSPLPLSSAAALVERPARAPVGSHTPSI
eukprot:COSAG01_NODE_8782_length_2661_cov_2.311085_3_plen_175_part_00